jgi:phage host-nuclease inhibitor protein Gam
LQYPDIKLRAFSKSPAEDLNMITLSLNKSMNGRKPAHIQGSYTPSAMNLHSNTLSLENARWAYPLAHREEILEV